MLPASKKTDFVLSISVPNLLLVGMPALETLFGHAPTAGDKNKVELGSDLGHKGGCGKQPCEECLKFVQLLGIVIVCASRAASRAWSAGYGIWFAFYTNLKNRAWKCEASYQL